MLLIPRLSKILRAELRVMQTRIERCRFACIPRLNAEQGHTRIAEGIAQGIPFAAAKVGSVELVSIQHYLVHRDGHGVCHAWGEIGFELHRNAGVFPPEPEAISQFCTKFIESLGRIDLLTPYHNPGEFRIAQRFAPQAEFMATGALEPYLSDRPWSQHLAGKRVLVITPFARSVQSQYARRREVWCTRPDVMPEFHLRVIRSPLSAYLAPPVHSDWSAGLRDLEQQMDTEPFEVALIGAGAWSLPLAAHARRLGSSAVHMGGALQILFGIRGARWDHDPNFQQFFNDSWIRPSHEERPAKCSEVEGACYW